MRRGAWRSRATGAVGCGRVPRHMARGRGISPARLQALLVDFFRPIEKGGRDGCEG